MLILLGIISWFFVSRNRHLILKRARPGHKIHTIITQVVRGNLDDRIIKVMLDVLNSESAEIYPIPEELVEKAGLELAKYGTPDSCLLAMHLSNFSGINYSEQVTEVIRNAACLFEAGSSDSRTIDIVRGKYLFQT
jgi:hypothetical protein